MQIPLLLKSRLATSSQEKNIAENRTLELPIISWFVAGFFKADCLTRNPDLWEEYLSWGSF